MAMTCDCAEGRHEVCRGAGPNYYCPQSEALEQECACGCHRRGPEWIARRFHEVYEELAPVFGWQTQERSAVPWKDVPPDNKRLMVKVVTRLLHEGVIEPPSRGQAPSTGSGDLA